MSQLVYAAKWEKIEMCRVDWNDWLQEQVSVFLFPICWPYPLWEGSQVLVVLNVNREGTKDTSKVLQKAMGFLKEKTNTEIWNKLSFDPYSFLSGFYPKNCFVLFCLGNYIKIQNCSLGGL
jgi:hypothetical protein